MRTPTGLFAVILVVFLAVALTPSDVLAQGSAVNGAIDGRVLDANGGVLPGVTVTLTNVATGESRVVVTNSEGLYRAPLLPLGGYTIEARLDGFKTALREGIELTGTMTATIGIELEVGGVEETVLVTADTPLAEPAKMELGRVLDQREVQNIPLVSRNPFNFALLQANVTGYENEEFGVPRVNANGTQMRNSYNLDGNSNTQKDRPGLRLQPMSEIFIKEVNLVTSGFAPEYGGTTGLVYNAVTPSGTNELHGSASYRFRRQGMSARPFYLAEAAPKPDTHVDTFNASAGGPIVSDRAFWYGGYEKVKRDLSADRVITVDPVDAARLGITDALGEGVIPAAADADFVIGKADVQISRDHRLSGRYTLFLQKIANNIGGGLNTTERALDFDDRADSVGIQLVSTFGGNLYNEARFSWSKRETNRVTNELTGSQPQITINGVANFGGADGNEFAQTIFQFSDSASYFLGNHSLKFGGSVEYIDDSRRSSVNSSYTFANIDNYLAARDGIVPRAYTNFRQQIGDPNLAFNSTFLGLFAQDDWIVNSRLMVLYGVRYDLYLVPEARPFAPNPFSQDFRIDKNNLAPRIGFSYDLLDDGRTVLTGHFGVMTDLPHLRIYRDAIQQNGDPLFTTFSLNPTSAGAPTFPNSLPPGAGTISSPSTIFAVAPDFANNYSLQTTLQIRHEVRTNWLLEVAYVNALGRNLPTRIDVNLINPIRELADGRPVFSTTVDETTRANPAFNHVQQYASIAESTYNAITFRVRKRFSNGLSFNSFYTLAKAEDNAVLGLIIGSTDTQHSDPTNINRDKGPTPFDVRHSFITSGVWTPLRDTVIGDTQIGFVLNFNSGLPFTIRSNRDINGDGVSNNDRPVGITRMAQHLGWYQQVDLRFSQFVPIRGGTRAEIFGEFTNLFNTENRRSVSSTVGVDAQGNAIEPIPADDLFRATRGYLARQFQFGVKFLF